MKPIVAIVGRANVGKSRLFNRIVGSRKALVLDTPGVTRDRHYAEANWLDRDFILVDTGGLEIDRSLDLEQHVTRQSMKAIEEADVVIALFDGSTSVMPLDREIVRILRKVKTNVVFAVNKIDDDKHAVKLNNFYELGVSDLIPISSEHGLNIDVLLDKMSALLPEKVVTSSKKEGCRVSVVGRPNVGKSTLINHLAGVERVVVHETAGTTRDSIDVELKRGDKEYIFVDTAGVKRRAKTPILLDKFSAIKTFRSIERSHIVCMMIDAVNGLTHQDLTLAQFIWQEGKGLLILVNKWDLSKTSWKKYLPELRFELGDLSSVPVLNISSSTGYNCDEIFEQLKMIEDGLRTEVTTSRLNEILERILTEHHLPTKHRALKIYYATQVEKNPLALALFANYPADIPQSYRNFLKRRIQEELGIRGVPLKIFYRKRA